MSTMLIDAFVRNAEGTLLEWRSIGRGTFEQFAVLHNFSNKQIAMSTLFLNNEKEYIVQTPMGEFKLVLVDDSSLNGVNIHGNGDQHTTQ